MKKFWSKSGVKSGALTNSSKNITGYRIPFHAHNDFLQVGAESGILALSFFIFFIFYPFYKFFKNFKHNHLHIVLLLSLSVFIFDSLINFPISRPISHIFLLFLLTALNNLKYDYEG